MTDPPIHIRCVVAGDPSAASHILVQRMESQWVKKGLVSSDTHASASKILLDHPNGKNVIHISFTVLTTPPRVLVTGADVLMTVFSPCHPLSFLHVWEMWWPIFAHLRHLPHFLVANRMELLVMPEVQAQMREKAISPITLDEVMTVVSEASPMTFDDVIPVSLQDEAPVRHSAFSPPVFSVVGDFCDLFVRRCCRQPAGPLSPLPARWAAAQDAAHALQLEARALPECADFRRAADGLLVRASRRTGAVHSAARPFAAFRDAGAAEWGRRDTAALEAAAAALREARGLAGAVDTARREIAALEAARRKGAEESAALEESIGAARAELRALRAEADRAGEAEESEETLEAETRAARCAYLSVWERHREVRAKVSARRVECAAVNERVENLKQKIANVTEASLAHLRARFATHYVALEALEYSCFVMEQSRTLGLCKAEPATEEVPKAKEIFCQMAAPRISGRQKAARMDLLRAMHAAMTRTVAPLLAKSNTLRRECRRAMQRKKDMCTTGVEELCAAEHFNRQQLEAEATLGMVYCIVNEFLLPAQIHGRCIVESMLK